MWLPGQFEVSILVKRRGGGGEEEEEEGEGKGEEIQMKTLNSDLDIIITRTSRIGISNFKSS